MYLWKSLATRPVDLVAEPSPLLTYIAGDFAPRVAGLWPEPHAAFLTAPAARRHLVCLGLPFATGTIDAEILLFGSQKKAIAIAVPSAPTGLVRALQRLGERAWSEIDYRRLVDLLARKLAGKQLRHLDQITAAEVRVVSALPEPLIDLGLGRLNLDEARAGLIAEADAAICKRDGAETQGRLIATWSAAKTAEALAKQVQVDLEPDVRSPPHPGTERLRPLVTKAALLDAASRFKNCLRDHLGYAGDGTSAYYEWIESPGAVVEIRRDRLHGWRLNQARLQGNKAILEPMRSLIVQDLNGMGVHVGRTQWQIDSALDDVICKSSDPVAPHAQVVRELFGEW